MVLLTAAQVRTLYADYPGMMPSGYQGGCWYSATADLPCSCDAMVALVQANVVTVSFIFSASDAAVVTLTFAADVCTLNGANPIGTGVETTGSPGCDFVLLIYESYWTDVIVSGG
jgi:hypothetical protein